MSLEKNHELEDMHTVGTTFIAANTGKNNVL
jgi:hypothetical protein